MSAPIVPLRPGDGGGPGPHGAFAEGETHEPVPLVAAWRELSACSAELHVPGALEQGLELRHVRRRIQPFAEAVACGEQVAALLAEVQPGEPPAVHAAHTALTALCAAGPLGLSRTALADLGVAALLHDAGHTRPADGSCDHALEGARRVLSSATWSPLALGVLQAAIAHHDRREAPLVAQVVAAADAYVTLLARQDGDTPWLSPAGSLARVLGAFRAHWHPAVAVALVRGLGLYPPGQVVQLDDGSFARALAPDPADPARPWIARLVDARGLPVPAWVSAATPLPSRRHVVRALPRQEWPEVEQERPAA